MVREAGQFAICGHPPPCAGRIDGNTTNYGVAYKVAILLHDYPWYRLAKKAFAVDLYLALAGIVSR
jgi:hypothetical protein